MSFWAPRRKPISCANRLDPRTNTFRQRYHHVWRSNCSDPMEKRLSPARLIGSTFSCVTTENLQVGQQTPLLSITPLHLRRLEKSRIPLLALVTCRVVVKLRNTAAPILPRPRSPPTKLMDANSSTPPRSTRSSSIGSRSADLRYDSIVTTISQKADVLRTLEEKKEKEAADQLRVRQALEEEKTTLQEEERRAEEEEKALQQKFEAIRATRQEKEKRLRDVAQKLQNVEAEAKQRAEIRRKARQNLRDAVESLNNMLGPESPGREPDAIPPQVEPSQAEQPQAEQPQAEPPQPEQPQAELPHTEPPYVEPPQSPAQPEVSDRPTTMPPEAAIAILVRVSLTIAILVAIRVARPECRIPITTYTHTGGYLQGASTETQETRGYADTGRAEEIGPSETAETRCAIA